MGVSNTCDEGAQCAQVANIGPIVDARPADTSPPFMTGEDVHSSSKEHPSETRHDDGVKYGPFGGH